MTDIEFADLIFQYIFRQDVKYYGSKVMTDNYWHSITQSIMYNLLSEKVSLCLQVA